MSAGNKREQNGGDADVTRLLNRADAKGARVFDDLVPLVYESLRQIAHDRLRREREGHTLNTTALVHEAYLRISGLDRIDWQDRNHFYAVASTIMRRVLVDYAKRRCAEKRGGRRHRVQIDDEMAVVDAFAIDVLDLDRALSELEVVNERSARVIEYRYFGGLEIDEVAAALDVSERTVKRDTRFARAWLAARLCDEIDRR